jgi:flotillin
MLMLEHFDNLVEASAKAISNIKFDKVVVWEGNGRNGKSATADWLQNMARTLPPMLQVMKDIGGVEVPDVLARFDSAKPDAKKDQDGRPTSESDDGADADVPEAEPAVDDELK